MWFNFFKKIIKILISVFLFLIFFIKGAALNNLIYIYYVFFDCFFYVNSIQDNSIIFLNTTFDLNTLMHSFILNK